MKKDNKKTAILEIVKSKIFKKSFFIMLIGITLIPIFGFILNYFFTFGNLSKTSLLTLFLIILIIGVIASLILTLFFSSLFVKRMLLIKKKSEEMVMLKFDRDLECGGEDEISELGIILNNLSSTLSSTLTILDEQNRELIVQVQKEKEIEQERLEFIASISHELKTPIAVIKGQTEGMLYNVGKFKNRDEYLKKNLDILDNMNKLVLEMIEMNRLNSIAVIEFEEVDFSKMLEEQITRVAVLMEKKNQKLVQNIKEDIIIACDKKFIERAVNNILMNAIKYSPNLAEIRVTFREEIDSYLLNVENTLVHVPNDEIENLFKQFSRLEKSGNKNTGGSGIGLYVVKKIFDHHGYQYQMYNTNEGVEFNLKISKREVQPTIEEEK